MAEFKKSSATVKKKEDVKVKEPRQQEAQTSGMDAFARDLGSTSMLPNLNTPKQTGMSAFQSDLMNASSRLLPNSTQQKQETQDNSLMSSYTAARDRLKQYDAEHQNMETPKSQINLMSGDKERDVLQQQANAEKVKADDARNASIMDADMKEINALSQADRQALASLSRIENFGTVAVNGFGDPANEAFQRSMEYSAAMEQLRKSGLSDQRISELSETLSRYNNAENAKGRAEGIDKFMDMDGVAGTAARAAGQLLSFPLQLGSGVAGTAESLYQTGLRGARGGSRYSNIDSNASGYFGGQFSQEMRSGIANHLLGDNPNLLNKTGKFLYSASNQMIDNILRAMTGSEGASLALAGLNSFQESFRSASERGGSPEQAWMLGVADATMEIATEFLPTDKIFKAGTPTSKRELISTIGKLATLEVPGELISLMGGWMADASIMMEKSESNLAINDMIAAGKSLDEAKKEIFKQHMEDIAMTAAETFVSSVGQGALTWTPRYLNEGRYQNTDDNTERPLPPESTVRGGEEGVALSQREAAASNVEDMFSSLFEKRRNSENGRFSNRMAQTVMADDFALSELARRVPEAGIVTDSEGKNNAKNRAAVKFALENLYQAQSDMGTDNAGMAELAMEDSGNVDMVHPAELMSDEELARRERRTDRWIASEETNSLKRLNASRYAGNDTIRNVFYELGRTGKEVNTKMIDAVLADQQATQALLAEAGLELPGTHSGDRQTIKQAIEYAYSHPRNLGANLNQTFAQQIQNAQKQDAADAKRAEDNEARRQQTIEENTRLGGEILTGNAEATNDQIEQILLDGVAIRQIAEQTGESLANVQQRFREILASRQAQQNFNERVDNAVDSMTGGRELTVDEMESLLSNPTALMQIEEDYGVPMRDLIDYLRWNIDYQNFLNQPSQQTQQEQNPLQPYQQMLQQNIQNANQNQNAPQMPSNNPPIPVSGDVGQSRTFTNSGVNNANPYIREGYQEALRRDPNSANYDVKHMADEQNIADLRVNDPQSVREWENYLMRANEWTPEDNKTAANILAIKRWNGEDVTALQQKRKQIGSKAGQLVQSFRDIVPFRDQTKTIQDATFTAMDAIENMTESDVAKRFYDGKGFENWKRETSNAINNLGHAISQVRDGDSASMREIIRQIAATRKTTAWWGWSNNLTPAAQKILQKLDFDTLSFMARAQLAAMPGDYQKRSMPELLHAFRVNAMLFGGSTINRNLEGNSTVGIMDSIATSTFGRLFDYGLSQFTNTREVGNDLKYTKEYMKGAKEATQMASLCVELGIPMEMDVSSDESLKYAANTRTFSPQGNAVIRALSAWEKYMQYALGVTDKFYEGGTTAAVKASLQELNAANADVLAQQAAQARTFKEDGKLSQLASGAQSFLNNATSGTKFENIKLGNSIMPFAKVPANVAQVGIDYTLGSITGVWNMMDIISRAKKGESIDVGEQRKAVTRTARGVTGMAIVGLAYAAAKAGIMKVHDDDDYDKKYAESAQGLRGAQFNITAAKRALNGGSAEWQKGDVLRSEDSLEPFNTMMYLGYAMAEADTKTEMALAPLKAAYQSFTDSPVMQGLTDTIDLVQTLGKVDSVDDAYDAVGQYAAKRLTSYVPNVAKNATYALDNVERDTRGQTAAETAWNQLKSALPGLRQTLPVKYDISGNPTKMYDTKLGALIEKMLDPQTLKTYNPNDVSSYLENLSNQVGANGDKINADSAYIDSAAPKKFAVNGEDFALDTKELREAYQSVYTNSANAFYSEMMNSEGFSDLPADEQVKLLASAKNYAAQIAKASVSDFKVDAALENQNGVPGIVSKMLYNHYDTNFDNAITKAGTVEAAEAQFEQYKKLSPEMQEQILKNSNGAAKYFLTAQNAKIGTETFLELYKGFKELGGETSSTKSNEWHSILDKAVDAGKITNRQKNDLLEVMAIRNTPSINNATNYEKFQPVFDDPDKARAYADKLTEVKPLEGASGVKDWQYFDKIVRDFDEGDWVDAMQAIATDGQYQDIQTVIDDGRDIRSYVYAMQLKAGAGSTKKNDIMNALKEGGFSDKDAKYFYSLLK